MNGEGLLGSMPPSWKVRMQYTDLSYCVPQYIDASENTTFEDPRLGTVPVDWEKLDVVKTRNDPEISAAFKNKNTGEVSNSDPRMFPEALKAKGVNVVSLKLI